MRKSKLLVPSLLVAATAPTISLVGCSKSSIEWDSRNRSVYQYKSELLEAKVTSCEDATNKYFDNVTPFIICDDGINSIYKNFYLESEPNYLLTKFECSKLDKAQHRISMKMYSEYQNKDGIVKGTLEVVNLPFQLVYNGWVSGSAEWCVVPKGFEDPSSSFLPEVLKNDDSWKFIFYVKKYDGEPQTFTVDNTTTDKEQINILATETAFSSTFMSRIPDPGK